MSVPPSFWLPSRARVWLVASLLGAGLPVGATAEAAIADPPSGAVRHSVAFSYVGHEESFTVPPGVTELTVEAIGAPGGSADPAGEPASGGRGAVASATLSTTPGSRFYVRVGGAGAGGGQGGAGGWNGGGSGSRWANAPGGGGGGATDLRTCGAADTACDGLDSRLVVAAGGGGAGVTQTGACPAVTGGDAGAGGLSCDAIRGTTGGGGAGTATAGGAGGQYVSAAMNVVGDGGPGAFGAGGDAQRTTTNPTYRGAGGGGGGWYGGGAGATGVYYSGAGGGGSSQVPAGGTVALADLTDAPGLRISYDIVPVTQVDVTSSQASLVATGDDTLTVTATATTAAGAGVRGLDVSFASTDTGQVIGPVTDHGDGTYTATLTGSTTPGNATITATASGTGTGSDVLGTLPLLTEAYAVTVQPFARHLRATGHDSQTVAAVAHSVGGAPLSGLDLEFTSTDAGHRFGPVTDHGDGTYTAVLHGSTRVGEATIGATVTGAGSPGLRATLLVTEPAVDPTYSVAVEPVARHLVGSGSDQVTVTAVARWDTGVPVRGLDVGFSSSDPDQRFGPVRDHGDGTYSTTLTSSARAGTAIIRVTATGASRLTSAEVVTDAYALPALTVTLSSPVEPQNGWYRAPVTAAFACGGNRPLASECPPEVVIDTEGRDQSVVRTVTDDQGSTVTVTAGPVSIDVTAPRVRVSGARDGKTYRSARRLVCRAGDALSGVAACTIARTRTATRSGAVVRWTATAVDVAGNQATDTGRYRIRKRR